MLNSVQSRIPEDRANGTVITPTPYIATYVRYRESATTSDETATYEKIIYRHATNEDIADPSAFPYPRQ